MTKRWTTALAAGALLLASCGESGGQTTVELVQGAGAAVIEQETARMEMRFEGGGQSFTMDGEIDFANAASSFVMDIPGATALEYVGKDTSIYIRSAGGGWTRIDLTGGAADLATQSLGADPRAMLEQLADADGISEDGTEEIRGVRTTKYSGRIDLEKAMRAQGMSDEQIELTKSQLNGAGEVDATVEVFLDDDGLAHRTVSRIAVGSLMDIAVTMDLLDFGTPVDIRVPSDDEVVRTESASSHLELNELLQSILAPA